MRRKAFTLVELLIVIGIIGLLATIGVSAYGSVSMNTRNQQRKANLIQLQKALEMYANDHGGLYPSTSGGQWGASPDFNSHPDTGSTGWIPDLAPAYIPVLPRDPHTAKSQNLDAWCVAHPTVACYVYRSNGTDYKLDAFCTPEGTLSASDPFKDPNRPNYGWAVWTPGGSAF